MGGRARERLGSSTWTIWKTPLPTEPRLVVVNFPHNPTGWLPAGNLPSRAVSAVRSARLHRLLGRGLSRAGVGRLGSPAGVRGRQPARAVPGRDVEDLRPGRAADRLDRDPQRRDLSRRLRHSRTTPPSATAPRASFWPPSPCAIAEPIVERNLADHPRQPRPARPFFRRSWKAVRLASTRKRGPSHSPGCGKGRSTASAAICSPRPASFCFPASLYGSRYQRVPYRVWTQKLA